MADQTTGKETFQMDDATLEEILNYSPSAAPDTTTEYPPHYQAGPEPEADYWYIYQGRRDPTHFPDRQATQLFLRQFDSQLLQIYPSQWFKKQKYEQKLCWVKPTQEPPGTDGKTPKAKSVPATKTPAASKSQASKPADVPPPKRNSLFTDDFPIVDVRGDMKCREFDDLESAGSMVDLKDGKKEPSLKEFANETSAHGIKNILSGSKYRRVSWFLAVVAALIFLTYNLVTVFLDYRNYPFQTVFTLTPKSEIVFPGVTICPLNQLDSTKVTHSAELEQILRIFSEGLFKDSHYTLDQLKNKSPYNEILGWNYWELMKNATPTIEETFVKCQFQKADMDCAQHMTYINTPTGRCYQFNLHENKTLKALRPGSRGGFSAVLRINQSGYTVSERHAAGFKLLLHDQYDYPDVFSRGQFFGPGLSYDVSFRKEQFKFLANPYKAYENSYCSDQFPANYNGSTEAYSMKSCIHHQDSILTSERCGCTEDKCTVLQYLNCYKPLFQEYYDNVTTIENVFDCAFACNFAGFLVGVSSVRFPSNKDLTWIPQEVNVSQEEFRDNFMELDLYFEDLLVRESIHVPVYGNWFNIMAMLGGNMGLFLGASLLTVGELIEVIVLMFLLLAFKVTCWGKGKGRNNEDEYDENRSRSSVSDFHFKKPKY